MKPTGFTLVELLVAIVISLVLASVAVPKFHTQLAKVKAAEVPIVFSTIAKAQHITYLETGRFFTASTKEEYYKNFGIILKSPKYFTYETSPSYQELATLVEIDGTLMQESGFWIHARVKRNFGKLKGGEVVEYNFNSITGEESAQTTNKPLNTYLQHYLFFNPGRYAQGTTSESSKTPATTSNKGHGNNTDHDDEDNPGQGNGVHGATPGYNDDGFDDDEKLK